METFRRIAIFGVQKYVTEEDMELYRAHNIEFSPIVPSRSYPLERMVGELNMNANLITQAIDLSDDAKIEEVVNYLDNPARLFDIIQILAFQWPISDSFINHPMRAATNLSFQMEYEAYMSAFFKFIEGFKQQIYSRRAIK